MKLSPWSFRAHMRHEGMLINRLVAGSKMMDIAERIIDVIRLTPHKSTMYYTCMCIPEKNVTCWLFTYDDEADVHAAANIVDEFMESPGDPDVEKRIADIPVLRYDPFTKYESQVCVCPFNKK